MGKACTASAPALNHRTLQTKDPLALCGDLLWEQAVTERSSWGSGQRRWPCLEGMGTLSSAQGPAFQLCFQLLDQVLTGLRSYFKTLVGTTDCHPWRGEEGAYWEGKTPKVDAWITELSQGWVDGGPSHNSKTGPRAALSLPSPQPPRLGVEQKPAR